MVTNGQDISRRCLFAFLIKYFTFVKFTSADPNLRIAAAANDGVADRSDPKSCDVFRPSVGPKSWSVSSVAPKPFSSNKSCHLVMLQAPERHLLLTKWDLSAFWVMTVLMMNKKNLWKTWSFVRYNVKHSVEITEICFHPFLKKKFRESNVFY